MGQKRRRIALSCVDCRRRKVKCDRTYPSCVRCLKGGYGDKCQYVTHTGEIHDPGLPTPDDDVESHHRSERALSWDEEADQYAASSRTNAAVAERHNNPAPKQLSRWQPAPPPTGRNENPDARERRFQRIAMRLMDLETYVYSAGGRPVSYDYNVGLPNPAVGSRNDRNPYADKYTLTEYEKVLMRGQSFRTQYFGPSHDLSILLQFEDLSKFVKDILLAIPSLSTAKNSLAKLREKEKKAVKANYDLGIETLVGLVPDRAFADRLVYEYLNSFETIYRVLHVPSFLHDYEIFWTSPTDARPEFIICLLLAMSLMYCVVPGGEEGFVGRSSARRETAQHWINVSQHWLDEHSQKHTNLAYYQIHVLLWMSRRMNCVKIKREWIGIGHLLRMFQAAGMHREPTLLNNKITVFDQEMRRRLWYTVVDLELQSTIDRGMTPTIGALDWDTLPPRNIHDEEIDMLSDRLPETKPLTDFTRTSYLVWTAGTLSLRIEMLYKINSIRSELDLDTVLQYDSKIRTLLDEMPTREWQDSTMKTSSGPLAAQAGIATATPSALRSPMLTHGSTASAAATPRQTTQDLSAITPTVALVSAIFTLHDLIVIVHQPFAAASLANHASTAGNKGSAVNAMHRHIHFLSRAARRDSCMTILSLVEPTSAEDAKRPNEIVVSPIQSRLFASLRDGHVRSGLSLAHDLATATQPSQASSTALNILSAYVTMLDDRVRHLGQGFHCYWITSSALSFVHAKQNPSVPTSTFAHAAADRVVKLHDDVIAGQLPRAKRLMTGPLGEAGSNERWPAEGAADSLLQRLGNGGDKSLDPGGTRRGEKRSATGRTRSSVRNNNELVDAITSVDGLASLAADQQGQLLSTGITAPDNAMLGADLSGGAMDMNGFMQDMNDGGNLIGDAMFGFQDFDWGMLMNTDPMSYMGGFDYPS